MSASSAHADLPDPGEGRAPRYTRRPFPAYRYVPGVHPHPNRNPAGHSYTPTPTLNRHPPWRAEEWRTLEAWLYGVDLFNCFYFWEAHEMWEGLWAAAERDSPQALLLQGLIQVAAALLKTHMGVLTAARTLSGAGLHKLRRAARICPALLGLDLHETERRLRQYFAPLQRSQLPRIGRELPVLCLRGSTEKVNAGDAGQ